MTIITECVSCEKRFEVAERYAGRKVRCKACGAVFRISSGLGEMLLEELRAPALQPALQPAPAAAQPLPFSRAVSTTPPSVDLGKSLRKLGAGVGAVVVVKVIGLFLYLAVQMLDGGLPTGSLRASEQPAPSGGHVSIVLSNPKVVDRTIEVNYRVRQGSPRPMERYLLVIETSDEEWAMSFRGREIDRRGVMQGRTLFGGPTGSDYRLYVTISDGLGRNPRRVSNVVRIGNPSWPSRSPPAGG